MRHLMMSLEPDVHGEHENCQDYGQEEEDEDYDEDSREDAVVHGHGLVYDHKQDTPAASATCASLFFGHREHGGALVLRDGRRQVDG